MALSSEVRPEVIGVLQVVPNQGAVSDQLHGSNQTSLQVEDLRKTFCKQETHGRGNQGISFSVAKGEMVGFLSGPNGAGKTTTIKSILGLLRPDSGTIMVDGIDCARNHREAIKRMQPQCLRGKEYILEAERLGEHGVLCRYPWSFCSRRKGLFRISVRSAETSKTSEIQSSEPFKRLQTENCSGMCTCQEDSFGVLGRTYSRPRR